MRRYSILHPLILSFYSQPLYRDVGRHWQGFCFTYLLLLLALAWVPTTIKAHLAVANFVQNVAAGIVKQIPPIRISNGEVSTKVETPYFITEPKDGPFSQLSTLPSNPVLQTDPKRELC